jgi:hypothetical protein
MKLQSELEDFGARATEADPGLYTLYTKEDMVYMIIWVDDILIASKSTEAINKAALMTHTAWQTMSGRSRPCALSGFCLHTLRASGQSWQSC